MALEEGPGCNSHHILYARSMLYGAYAAFQMYGQDLNIYYRTLLWRAVSRCRAYILFGSPFAVVVQHHYSIKLRGRYLLSIRISSTLCIYRALRVTVVLAYIRMLLSVIVLYRKYYIDFI